MRKYAPGPIQNEQVRGAQAFLLHPGRSHEDSITVANADRAPRAGDPSQVIELPAQARHQLARVALHAARGPRGRRRAGVADFDVDEPFTCLWMEKESEGGY